MVVNNICDATVQSRARATLPNAYLSINRIKGDTSQTKPSNYNVHALLFQFYSRDGDVNTCNSHLIAYGVFARKMIPSKTKFGPVEGVLIKLENDDETLKENEFSLHLTVESEDGKFSKLDVSNDG